MKEKKNTTFDQLWFFCKTGMLQSLMHLNGLNFIKPVHPWTLNQSRQSKSTNIKKVHKLATFWTFDQVKSQIEIPHKS